MFKFNYNNQEAKVINKLGEYVVPYGHIQNLQIEKFHPRLMVY